MVVSAFGQELNVLPLMREACWSAFGQGWGAVITQTINAWLWVHFGSATTLKGIKCGAPYAWSLSSALCTMVNTSVLYHAVSTWTQNHALVVLWNFFFGGGGGGDMTLENCNNLIVFV